MFSGSSGSHCTVSSATTGKGRFGSATGSTTSGNHDATYTDYTSIGDSSNNAITSYHNTSSGRLNLQNCTFTSCGRTEITNSHAAAYVNVDTCTWTSTVATRSFVPLAGQALTSGTRTLNNNYFDTIVGNSSTILGYTFTGNCLAGDWSITTGAAPCSAMKSS